MQNRTLLIILCVVGLSGCASKVPTAYCPYPPIMPEKELNYILDNTNEPNNVYLNKYRKYLCKYWNVYDRGEYKRNCKDI